MIALKQRTRVVHASILVEEESIFKGKRPVETQEARVAAGKIGTCAGLKDCGVVVEQAGADGGPGEEIEGYGVRGG